MKKSHVKQMRDPFRRQAILDAALLCFIEFGYSETTLAIICTKSGASVGSVYHFFANKADIALELIKEAVAGWAKESGFAAVKPLEAHAAIQASIRGLLQWAEKNDALFRFMEEMRARSGSSPAFSDFSAVFSEGQKKAVELYAKWVESKLVKDIPWSVAYALMNGPSYHYLRMRTVGKKIPRRDIELLADAAWEAVRTFQ